MEWGRLPNGTVKIYFNSGIGSPHFKCLPPPFPPTCKVQVSVSILLLLWKKSGIKHPLLPTRSSPGSMRRSYDRVPHRVFRLNERLYQQKKPIKNAVHRTGPPAQCREAGHRGSAQGLGQEGLASNPGRAIHILWALGKIFQLSSFK